MNDLSAAVLEHANRGVRLQLLLRGALVAFLVMTIALLPPVEGVPAYYAILLAYALGAAAFAWWAWPGGAAVARFGWLALFVDLAVLAILTLVAGVDAQVSWTSYVLVVGFFLLPVLAATQLRPGVCAAVVVPTVVVYLAASFATQADNAEPWQSIVLRTFLLACVGVACIGLSRIQRSRVAAIGRLLDDRTGLLGELVRLEDRERRALAERLHDGALQYVLAARLDLDDLPTTSSAETVGRIDHALTESSRLLRSTVAELHPAVLEHAGLARALHDLTTATARPGLSVDVDTGGWPASVRTPVDALLFGAARELLTNVVKHADASHVKVSLVLDGGWAQLAVTDDGRGIADLAGRQAVDAGHIGLHSQVLRVEAAGGSLTVTGDGSGTTGSVVVPVPAAARR